jgi:hypothetical protein
LVSLKQDAYQKIDVKENQNRTVYLAATANGTLANLPLMFSIVDYPSNGKVDPNHAILKGKSNDYTIVVKYIPNTNYTGPDSFTYKFTAINIPTTNVSFATNTRPNSDVGKIDIVVNPPNSKLYFVTPPLQRAGLAFILSLIIVFLIFLLAYVIIRKIRSKQKRSTSQNSGVLSEMRIGIQVLPYSSFCYGLA